MHRCVSVLLGVSALVLCISGLPLNVDSVKTLDHVADKLHSAELLKPVKSAEDVKKITEVSKDAEDAEDAEEEADTVERAYYPSYQAPSYGAPYGYPSNNYGGNNYDNGGSYSPLTDPYLHKSKATVAAQNLYAQGNAQTYGSIAADSYAPYSSYPASYRRRRAVDALNAAVDHLTDKMKNIVEAEDIKKALSDKSAHTVDEVEEADEKTSETVERDYGYAPAPSYGAPYGSPYGGGGYGNGGYNPYNGGNSYNPYNGGNSYNPYNSYPSGGNYGQQAPNDLDSAKVNQAASSTKSLSMSAGASSQRPTYNAPSYAPSY